MRILLLTPFEFFVVGITMWLASDSVTQQFQPSPATHPLFALTRRSEIAARSSIENISGITIRIILLLVIMSSSPSVLFRCFVCVLAWAIVDPHVVVDIDAGGVDPDFVFG